MDLQLMASVCSWSAERDLRVVVRLQEKIAQLHVVDSGKDRQREGGVSVEPVALVAIYNLNENLEHQPNAFLYK